MRSLVGGIMIALLVSACGPSADDKQKSDEALKNLTAENVALKAKVAELEKRLSEETERPERLLARAQQAYTKRDFAAAVKAADRLLELHPASPQATPARGVASRGRARIAEEIREVELRTKQERRRAAAESEKAEQTQRREVIAALHRNLDGVGRGFVTRWQWKGDSFALFVDETKYMPGGAAAAAMTARAIFETHGVSLPSRLEFRDPSGNLLDSGPFANVPGMPK